MAEPSSSDATPPPGGQGGSATPPDATPPAGPAALPKNARARPLRTGLYLLTPLVWVLLAGLACVAALVAAARWVLLTEEGTAWLIARLPMVSEARGVQGALLGPRWQIERLRVQWAGGTQWLLVEGLVSEGMAWHWRPVDTPAGAPADDDNGRGTARANVRPTHTLWAALDIQRLEVRRLQIETGPRGPRPIPLPAHLAPPLRLTVGQVAVGELRIDALEPVRELTARALVLDGSPGARHRVEQLAGRGYGVRVQAGASLANLRPFELQAQATVVPALVAVPDAPPWAAVLGARGPLAEFEARATLRGRPRLESAVADAAPEPAAQRRPGAGPGRPSGTARAGPGTSTGTSRGSPASSDSGARAGPALDLTARVRPLEAWPVRQLNAATDHLDLAALWAGAPQTRLSGEAQLQAAAADAPLLLKARLANLAPGRWNEQRLPIARLEFEARGEASRPERLELSRFELQLAEAAARPGAATAGGTGGTGSAGGAGMKSNAGDAGDAGRLEGRALWEAHQLTLDARLQALRPQRLDGRAPAMALSGPVHLAIGGLPSPDPRAKTPVPPWSATGRIELDGRIEGAPRPVSLRAEGSANAQGLELRQVQVLSGEARAELRASLARGPSREWTFASTGTLAEFDPLPWWPGEAGAAWRQGPHRLNGGWQFELRAPAEAAQLAPLTLLQRVAGKGQLRVHDSVLAGVPLAGEATLGYVAAGAATGSAAAAGPGASGAASGAASAGAGPVVATAAAGTLRADFQVGGNRVLVEGQGDPTGTTGGAPAVGTGIGPNVGQSTGTSDRWRVEVRAGALATLAPLARLHPSLAEWVPRQGSLNAELTAQGRWPRVATQGQVRGEALQVGTLSLQRADANWRIDLGDATEAPLTLDAQVSGLRLGEQRLEDARAELRGTRAEHRLELNATLPVAPAENAARVLNIANRSGTRARLSAQGQWRPEAAGGGRWLAQIDTLELSPGAPTEPAPAAAARAGGATSQGSPATAASAAMAATGAASAASAAGATGSAATTRLDPRPDARSDTRWAEARNLRAQLLFDAQGRLLSLSAEPGRLRLADTFNLRWEAVQVDFRQPRADFTLRADVEPFALPPLLARLVPAIGWQGDLRLAAYVSLRAAERFEADLVFARVDGDLHIETQGELQLLGLTDFRLLLKVRDGLWDFEPVFRGRGLGEIRGQLRVRTTPERRWPHDDAAIEGQLQARVPDIGVWGHWVPPGWRLAGELATMAQLGGRFAEPTYTGEITGQGLAVRNLLQGVNVSDGRLRIKLAGSSANIESFTLRGGEGRAEVTGSAELGSAPSARLKLVAERFRVLGRVDRQLTASGQAELQFAGETSRLDGRFRVDEGLFDFTRADAPSLDEDVSVRGTEADADSTSNDGAAQARPRQRLTLGVDVDLGDRLQAKGRGVDTGLIGNVRITNPGGRLAVRGKVESVRGTYAAYGQKLVLEGSSIAFEGPPDNPRLDIYALRPNLDIRVGLHVSGPLQGLRVRLFSQPEMAETDKLSWLVLGRASDGLGRNDTAMLQRAAVALLAGEGEAPTDAFMRRLGIDELTLKQSDGEVRETVVSLGKQLSRRWYLGYERGVNATTGTWQLIYRVAQRFTLRAQSGLENSLDLIWTWRLQQPPVDGAVRRSLPAVPP